MKRYLYLLISLFLLLTSCASNKPQDELPVNSSSITTVSEPGKERVSRSEPDVEPTPVSIVEVSHEDVGLPPYIPPLPIELSRIHPEIVEALDLQQGLSEPEWLPDSYYAKGIEMNPYQRDHTYIILNQQWNHTIIDQLTMKSSRDELLSILGEPTVKTHSYLSDNETEYDWIWIYKTEHYYISFSGMLNEDSLGYVYFQKAPAAYDGPTDLLKTVLQSISDHGPYEEWEGKEYFNEPYFQYGGHVVCESDYGITVFWDALYGFYVNVYQNYPGALYQFLPDDSENNEWTVSFQNSDKYMRDIPYLIQKHYEINDKTRYLHTSSDGRYSFDYEFLTHKSFNASGGYTTLLIYDNWGLRNPFYIHCGSNGQAGWIDGTYQIWGYYDDFNLSGYIASITDDGYEIDYKPDLETFPEGKQD